VSAPARTPLVLLHGWGMTPAVWQPLVAALGEEAGVDVRAPALPGHGGDGGHGDDGAARPAATLAAWAEALVRALPPAAVLVGWSLGALLALELARTRPDRITRLILFGSTPRFVAAPDWPHGLDAATVAAFVDGYATSPAATLRRFFALQSLGDAGRGQILPRLGAAGVAHAGQALPALADGLRLLAETDLRAGIASIGQPTCLIHGDGDALMPPAAARWLAGALPRARLVVLENRGHAPFLSDPTGCAAVIRASLDAAGNRP
jgi:pimeloyl-[acyl-carrier protein] methyl ester esterase